jgi:hypothetical protein
LRHSPPQGFLTDLFLTSGDALVRINCLSSVAAGIRLVVDRFGIAVLPPAFGTSKLETAAIRVATGRALGAHASADRRVPAHTRSFARRIHYAACIERLAFSACSTGPNLHVSGPWANSNEQQSDEAGVLTTLSIRIESLDASRCRP